MGPLKGEIVSCDTYSKKKIEDVPVASCQGWVDPCEFCDKRFGNWVEPIEEELLKIPAKPGFLMVALKNKGTVEVVDILLDKNDIQKMADTAIDAKKELVADKKLKSTKSVILCRWMTFQQAGDKDVSVLCAHWKNNSVLPRLSKTWPGLDLLENSKHLVFSEKQQKWCYPQKDPVWRKPKLPSKIVEIVEGCSWSQPCEICDANFSKWQNLDDVVDNNRVPAHVDGIYMTSVRYGKNREVLTIVYDPVDIKLNIASTLARNSKSSTYVLKHKKYFKQNPSIEVRWTELSTISSDNSCFLYAHWLNAGSRPSYLYHFPGEKIVEQNKKFVLNSCQKWSYEIDTLRQMKSAKPRNKKHILKELEADLQEISSSNVVS